MDLDLTAGVPADSIAEGQVSARRVGDQGLCGRSRSGRVLRRPCAVHALPWPARGRHRRWPNHSLSGYIAGVLDLATGDAVCAPALDPLPCWRVERRDGRIVVGAPLAAPSPHTRTSLPSSILSLAAALRALPRRTCCAAKEYDGPVSILSVDSDPPVDRPNLSKDYLAGEAQDDCLPLWPSELYAERRIDLARWDRVNAFEPNRTDGAARRWLASRHSVRC